MGRDNEKKFIASLLRRSRSNTHSKFLADFCRNYTLQRNSLLICSYIILSTLSLQKLAFEILTLPTK